MLVIFVEDDAGTTEHLPFIHPQVPAPQSSGPSQDAVHMRLHTVMDAGFTQLVGWQHWAGTHSAGVEQVWLSTGTIVVVGVGVQQLWLSTGEGAVHPARRMATMQITRSMSTDLSMQGNYHV